MASLNASHLGESIQAFSPSRVESVVLGVNDTLSSADVLAFKSSQDVDLVLIYNDTTESPSVTVLAGDVFLLSRKIAGVRLLTGGNILVH
jgi:hypothetical protein